VNEPLKLSQQKRNVSTASIRIHEYGLNRSSYTQQFYDTKITT